MFGGEQPGSHGQQFPLFPLDVRQIQGLKASRQVSVKLSSAPVPDGGKGPSDLGPQSLHVPVVLPQRGNQALERLPLGFTAHLQHERKQVLLFILVVLDPGIVEIRQDLARRQAGILVQTLVLQMICEPQQEDAAAFDPVVASFQQRQGLVETRRGTR